MRTSIRACICTVLWVLGCGDGDGERDSQSGSGAVTMGSSISATAAVSMGGVSAGEGSGGVTTGMTGETGAVSGVDVDTGAIKFDVGGDSSGGGLETGEPETGCQKIDFLFVVDNSGSMEEEQQALATSFDGFITSIQNTVMAEDYHIMVIDTDAASSSDQECFVLCGFLPECNGYPCTMLPMASGCDATLGAGLTSDPKAVDCGITGGHRYMVDGQPNLSDTFECVARVGTNGDGSERPMEAMVAAISGLSGPGKCNDGFLRKDALLVVTFITDEEDDEESNGNPAGWHASLVAAKVGDQQSIVVLGLIGDTDQPNPVCAEGEAEASPRLREFSEMFPFGTWGSICSADYAPFFDASVSVIDTACSQFEPPG